MFSGYSAIFAGCWRLAFVIVREESVKTNSFGSGTNTLSRTWQSYRVYILGLLGSRSSTYNPWNVTLTNSTFHAESTNRNILVLRLHDDGYLFWIGLLPTISIQYQINCSLGVFRDVDERYTSRNTCLEDDIGLR